MALVRLMWKTRYKDDLLPIINERIRVIRTWRLNARSREFELDELIKVVISLSLVVIGSPSDGEK